MKRNLLSDLKIWKDQTDFMPLLLRGARQVGKTFLIREFGTTEFSNCVEINFELLPKLKRCFVDLDPQQIISELEITLNINIEPGKTLLFLDEIQECPQAIMALRYFKEKLPKLHIIGAGSLLEFVLNEEEFRMPVGRVEYLHLKPLSFLEFLDATDNSKLHSYLSLVSLEKPPSENIHEQSLKLIREYMSVGGMPDAVMSYKNNPNAKRCQEIQSALLMSYRNDFGKYARYTQHKYLQIAYEGIPGLVSNWFKYVNLDANSDPRQLRMALIKLADAGIIHFVYDTRASGLPLISHVNFKQFKLFFVDIGLTKRALGIDLQLMTEASLLLVNRGALTEQLVAQELIAYFDAREPAKLFTWHREEKNADAEIDFVITLGSQIVGIDVKAGSTGKLRSIQQFLNEKNLPLGVRISERPLGLEKRLLSVPFYLIHELPRLWTEAYEIIKTQDSPSRTSSAN